MDFELVVPVALSFTSPFLNSTEDFGIALTSAHLQFWSCAIKRNFGNPGYYHNNCQKKPVVKRLITLLTFIGQELVLKPVTGLNLFRV